jgi:hypothetical protein
MRSYFLLQKRPDGQTQWDDEEGRTYNFAERLPNAKNLVKNSVVLFYRPLRSGTPEDGCVFARARVSAVEVVQGRTVDAYLTDYVGFQRPVPLQEVGDPRANPQHSFQPVDESWYLQVLRRAGAEEGASS